MSHQELLETAKEAISRVFCCTTVDQATTRDSLEELIEEIEVMLESLRQ